MQKDLTNNRYGKLKVIENTNFSNSNREKLWLCECDCGNQKNYTKTDLEIRGRKSCGCEKEGHAKDLTDIRSGKLVAVKWKGKNSNNESTWRCKCDCGNFITIRSNHISHKKRTHCGCEKKGRLKHNHSTRKKRSLTYISWGNMIQRCYNKNYTYYKYYGGRGIKVCRKWWKFKNFYKDMGDRPKNMTLERINNEKGYYPSNCKWATRKEQVQNRRKRGKQQ